MRRPPLSLLLLLVACAADEEPLLGNQGPRIEVFAAAADEPELIDFGEVPAGSDAVATLVIRNVGGEPLELGAVNLSRTDYLDTSDIGGLPGRLDPGAEVDFEVLFQPRFDLRFEGRLTVGSSDPERPEVEVAIVGDGLAPTLRIDPSEFQFGTGLVGCEDELEIELTNIGRAPLVLGEMSLMEDGSTFALAERPEPGTSLEPGESVAAALRWTSDDHLPDTATLHVASNDPLGSRSAVFAGSSVTADPVTDVWVADGNLALDLVIVLDANDPDVATELVSSTAALFAALSDVGFDFRVGIVDGTGALLGPPIDAGSGDPEAEVSALSALAAAPTGAGLGAAWACLAPGGECVAALARPGADLHVVLVSDGPLALPDSLSSLALTIVGLRSPPAGVSISAITGGATGCSGPEVTAPADGGVQALVGGGIGVFGSVCEPGRGETLVAAARRSIPALDRFVLSADPAPATIHVAVDGAANQEWTWDDALGAIVFPPGEYPASGADVEVLYRALACE